MMLEEDNIKYAWLKMIELRQQAHAESDPVRKDELWNQFVELGKKYTITGQPPTPEAIQARIDLYKLVKKESQTDYAGVPSNQKWRFRKWNNLRYQDFDKQVAVLEEWLAHSID